MRRLTIARATTPSIKPAIIDSHGKPGIAGNTIGVETEIVVELLVVVGVLTTVSVDTDVLTTVVVNELVVVIDVVEALADVELVIEDTVVVVLCVVATCWPTTGGLAGSKWKMPASGVAT